MGNSFSQNTRDDAFYMRRCCDLAEQAVGYTSPNPMVGSVIVKDGDIVGEGFHPEPGEPHAEVFALRAAGENAQDATLYVNLEPCNHTGRTPPCSKAVIASGIRRVVIGMRDPNAEAAGGVERLREAGIEVTVGVEEARCQKLNEAFVHRVKTGRPFGIWKYAMTLDGKIATATGHSAWVSGKESRRRVHLLRGQSDAVIVGGNTVRLDNPNLTSHGTCDRNPLRIVMSRQLNLPTDANLWQADIAPTLVFTQTNADTKVLKTLQDKGVEVVTFPELTPAAAMAELRDRNLQQILWECGGVLAAEAIQQGAVQKVWAFVAPKLVGGQDAPTPLGGLGINRMDQALALKNRSVETVGDDLLVEGYLM